MFTVADVSKWQEQVDYAAFLRGGGAGFICKAGGSNGGGEIYIDRRYRQHAAGARAVGALLGHYWMNGESSPTENARAFVRGLVAYQPGDPLIIDVEGIDKSPYWLPGQVNEFCDTIRGMVDSPNLFAYMNNEPLSKQDWRGVRDSGVRLWKATYTTAETTGSGVWPEWTMWQYTDRGVLGGFLGDLSRVRDDAWRSPAGPAKPAKRSRLLLL